VDATTTTSIPLTLNGEPREVPSGSTVLDLLASLARDPRTVAVERNGEIVRRPDYAATVLAAGDRLEVVHFVQGG
jgi:thiamine biosynthesis protein ThiS